MLLKVRLSEKHVGQISYEDMATLIAKDLGVKHTHTEANFGYEVATFAMRETHLSNELLGNILVSDFIEGYRIEPEQDVPATDVLYEDTERRVVMLGSDYQHGITDTVLEMAERGYTSRLVYRTEGDAVRIPLDAATARKIASELEQWEKEHEDAHPF